MSNPFDSMLRPAQALALMQVEAPAGMAPENGEALVQRSRRGNGPPFHQDPARGPKAPLVADPNEVRAWCREHWPPAAKEALSRAEASEVLLRDLLEILAEDECICGAMTDAEFHNASCSVHLAWRISEALGEAAGE